MGLLTESEVGIFRKVLKVFKKRMLTAYSNPTEFLESTKGPGWTEEDKQKLEDDVTAMFQTVDKLEKNPEEVKTIDLTEFQYLIMTMDEMMEEDGDQHSLMEKLCRIYYMRNDVNVN